MRLLKARQVRAVDRRAIEDLGMSGLVLMENAGRGATSHLLSSLPSPSDCGPIFCIAGAGNNGGDAYVIARHLLNAGYDTRTLVCVPRDKVRGDADANLRILEHMKAPLFPATQSLEWELHLPALRRASLIVDGLLGTGLDRDVGDWFLTVLDDLNALHEPWKVALDVPSGLDPDRGVPRPRCFHADLTITFAAAKVGLLAPTAASYVGKLTVVDIGVPNALLEEHVPACETLERATLRRLLPPRSFRAHKGTFGHLLLFAGSAGKAGAALLAATGALRTGVGLCTLVTDPAIAHRLEGEVPEVMCEALPTMEPNAGLPSALLQRKSALVLGPGWSQHASRERLLHAVLTEVSLPVALDADALNLLAGNLDWLRSRSGPTVLTPHPGEMARLTGKSAAEIQRDRLQVATEFAAEHGVVLVLKGARTLVAAPSGACWMNLTGHAGLATGGSGDVLAGMIGSFLAQGLAAEHAACLGVHLHGLAADTLVPTHGSAGMLPSDLLQTLPALLKDWESPSNIPQKG